MGFPVRFAMFASLLASAATSSAQITAHEAAQRIDRHYNRLTSLQCAYAERYDGMGQQREEHGTLLLKRPGRMRWTYTSGKVFVLDGKVAVSYTPGDPQAQRVPAKQLDDLRSPLRFLLGHTQIEKELDHLTLVSRPDGVTVSGSPRYEMGAGEQRIQTIAITADPMSGTIRNLSILEVDGSSTEFRFSGIEENVPTRDEDFQFIAPKGVIVVEGLPPV